MKYVMKFLHILLISLLFLLNNLYSYSLTPLQFKKGETLIYDITVYNIKVGEQITTVKDIVTLSNRQVYYIHTSIKTTKIIDKVYKLKDTIETYIDTETYLPILIKTKIREGKYKNDITIIIDNNNKIATYKDKYGKKIFEFEDSLFGLVSLIYYIRLIKPYQKEKINFTVHNKRRKQIVKTLAKYSADLTYISALKRKAKSIIYRGIEQKSNIWITNDANRIPFKFTSIRIPVMSYGYITLLNKLRKYKKGE